MSSNLSRRIIDALMPPGSIWVPADDEGLDQLLDGIADSQETTREDMALLALLRSPQFTPILADLELEYGIIPDDSVSEQTRRERLFAAKTAKSTNGTAEELESILRAAGFDVFVHENDPPVDPNLFLEANPATICGNQNAVCGNESAFCGSTGGELIVNGDTFNHIFFTGTIVGGLNAVCGNEEAICRGEGAFGQELIEYEVPTDPGYWPLIFFVGGPAVRNVSGELTEIARASVPLARKDELISSIVRFKPVHSWAGLIAGYI